MLLYISLKRSYSILPFKNPIFSLIFSLTIDLVFRFLYSGLRSTFSTTVTHGSEVLPCRILRFNIICYMFLEFLFSLSICALVPHSVIGTLYNQYWYLIEWVHSFPLLQNYPDAIYPVHFHMNFKINLCMFTNTSPTVIYILH